MDGWQNYYYRLGKWWEKIAALGAYQSALTATWLLGSAENEKCMGVVFSVRFKHRDGMVSASAADGRAPFCLLVKALRKLDENTRGFSVRVEWQKTGVY